jgi:three-Cys-motif partner protein
VNPGKRNRWPELVRSVSVDDGLPTRESGKWTVDKLWFWHRYVDITTTAMVDSPVWEGGVVYVDLFAGPGVCTNKENGRRCPGSPLIAAHAKKPFTKIVLVEKSRKTALACEARMEKSPAASRYRVIKGDCNRLIGDVKKEIPEQALTLAFIDPQGVDIEFETLRELSRGRAVDFLILLADAVDAARNLSIYEKPDSKMDRFLGPESGWRSELRDLRSEKLRQALCSLYKRQLQRLGYRHFAHRTMEGERGPLYKLVFASKSARGLEFWRIAASRHRSGQQNLFDY